MNYNVKATADLSQNPDSELEGIRHTGGTLYKEELQVANVESVELILNAAEEATLRLDAKNKVKATMGFKEEDGRVKNGEGRLKIEPYTTMESTMTVTMIPDGEWEITGP